MIQKTTTHILVLLTVCLLQSCILTVDDQQGLPRNSDIFTSINPSFIVSEGEITQGRKDHKITIAISGSGVDYNHPSLFLNMKYNLEEIKGNNKEDPLTDADQDGIFGNFLGYDFTGNDGYPSYRLFSNFTHERDMKLERGLMKTTAIADLIANNDRAIGIVPYKIFPVSYNEHSMFRVPGITTDKQAATKEVFYYLNEAIHLAAKQNAQIFFIHSVDHFTSNPFGTKELEKGISLISNTIHHYRNRMLFVLSPSIFPGNSLSRCAFKGPNVLCISGFFRGNHLYNNLMTRTEATVQHQVGQVVAACPADLNNYGEFLCHYSGNDVAAAVTTHHLAKLYMNTPCILPQVLKSIVEYSTTRIYDNNHDKPISIFNLEAAQAELSKITCKRPENEQPAQQNK